MFFLDFPKILRYNKDNKMKRKQSPKMSIWAVSKGDNVNNRPEYIRFFTDRINALAYAVDYAGQWILENNPALTHEGVIKALVPIFSELYRYDSVPHLVKIEEIFVASDYRSFSTYSLEEILTEDGDKIDTFQWGGL